MVTLHGITQVKPSFVKDGCALLCKKKFASKLKAKASIIKKESYIELQEVQIGFAISNPNIDFGYFNDPYKKLYVVIAAGGKWGYGESFVKLIKELAPFLEDAVFYLDYELGNIEQFKIYNGKLYHTIVAQNTTIFSYIEKTYTKDKIILDRLYQTYLHSFSNDDFLYQEKEALKIANKAIKLDSKNWKTYRYKGSIYNQIGKYQAAIKYFTHALKLAPDSGQVKVVVKRRNTNTETVYISTAQKALQYNSFEVQLYWLDEAQKQLVLDYKLIYCSIGFAYKMLKQYDKALEHYLKAEKITPTYNYNTPLHYLSSYFIEVGEYGKALKYCDELIGQANSIGDFSIAYYNKACVYAKKNDTKKAIYFLTFAIELQPHKYKKYAKHDDDLKILYKIEAFKELIK